MENQSKSFYTLVVLITTVILVQLMPKVLMASLNPGETIDDRLYGAIVMYNGSPKVYAGNALTNFDKNDLNVHPLIKQGHILVPAIFVLEKSGAVQVKSSDTSNIEMSYHDSSIRIIPKLCKMSYEINGAVTEVAVENINQRLYAKVTDLSKILDKKLFIYNNLIVLSNSSGIFDIKTEKNLINEAEKRVSSKMITIPVLMYHHFRTQVPQSHIGTIVTPQEFENHIKYLKENKYNFIFFSDLYDYVNSGKPLPDNPIILTLDDGYLSNYTYAFPILKKYNAKATIFIVTDFVGKTIKDFPHFTWEQAKIMQNSGFVDIQNHTQKHDFFDEMSGQAILESALNAQNLIDKNLGTKKVRVLAYPGGNYSEYTRSFLLKHGFDIQVTGQDKLVTNYTSLGDISRINIRHGLSGKDILRIINDLKGKL